MRTEADVMDSMKEHFGGVSDPRVPGANSVSVDGGAGHGLRWRVVWRRRLG